jgi:predicted Zn finger-like uncharacterized protein
MADKFQTQCPHCGVKFQISSQQLSLANGNVRCGSCLQVFQASANLVPLGGGTAPAGVASARSASAAPSARPAAAAPRKPAAPAPAPPPPVQKPRTPPPPVDSLAGIDTDDDLADMILKELESPQPPPKPAPRPAAKPAAAPPPARPTAPVSIDDEDDLADMILKELENPEPAAPPPPAPRAPAARVPAPRPPAAAQEPQWAPPPAAKAGPAAEPQWAPPGSNRYGIEDNKTKVSLGKGQESNLLDDLDGIDDKPDARFGDSRTTNRVLTDDDADIFGGGQATLLDNIDEPVDESWAKELIGEKVEDEKDALVRKFTQIKADNLSLANTGVQPKSALQQRLASLERGETSASNGIDDLDSDDLDFLNDGSLTMQDVEIPGMEDQMHEFDTAGMAHEVEWGREIFWGALCAVFSLVLLGQYMVANFDDLSRDASWRGVYEVACGAIGCEIPGESNVSLIQGAHLVVRSHPRAQNALVVDAIVYNRASFAQPFPDLELSFSDRSGKLLAGRVFKPEEYLKGELAGSEAMPPDTPVHLSLEIVDPSTEAVNYELRFLAPAASS